MVRRLVILYLVVCPIPVTLKFFGVIGLGWWWTLAPLWAPSCLVLGALIGCFAVYAIGMIFGSMPNARDQHDYGNWSSYSTGDFAGGYDDHVMPLDPSPTVKEIDPHTELLRQSRKERLFGKK